MLQNRTGVLRALQLTAIAAAVACIILGAARGEPAIVLRKAINICLECIGVGG